MQYKIRKMTEEEYPLLEDFLYESLFVPQGKPPFPRSILQTPEMQMYIADFGSWKITDTLMTRRLPLPSPYIKNTEAWG